MSYLGCQQITCVRVCVNESSRGGLWWIGDSVDGLTLKRGGWSGR